MAVEITERWSDRSVSKGRRWSATRGFDITGVADEFAASNAVDSTTGLRIPRYNDPHPNDARLRAEQPTIREQNPGHFRARVRYREPERTSSLPDDDGDDPLQRPVRIRPTVSVESAKRDRDRHGNPIINSSRQPYTDYPPSTVEKVGLVVVRNEPFFDFGFAADMVNSVNEDDLIIEGQLIVGPERAFLRGFEPTGEYSLSDEYVEVAYTIDLRADGFDLRLRDEGTVAWAMGSTGLVDKDAQGVYHIYEKGGGERVTSPVRLDGRGRPFDMKRDDRVDQAFQIGKQGWGSEGIDPPPGATVETEGEDGEDLAAVFLLWQDKKRRRFSRLGL